MVPLLFQLDLLLRAGPNSLEPFVLMRTSPGDVLLVTSRYLDGSGEDDDFLDLLVHCVLR